MQNALLSEQQHIGSGFAGLNDQNYRTLMELCPDALIVHDGHMIVFANLAMAHLVRADSVNDIIGCPVLEFVAEPSQDLVKERIRQVQQTGYAPLVDETWRRLDGTEVQVEVAARHMSWVAPKAAMVIVRDVTERRRLEAERETLLAEKELLMREVHHRVANSLQLVRSMLNLQARGSCNEAVKIQLSEASARIGTIGILHSRLQQDSSVVEGEVQPYIEGVMTDLRTSLGETYQRPIILDPGEMPPLTLKADLLVALGLITTEAVTNSIKYGSGRIRVRLAKSDAHVEISIEDEGTGFPKDFDLAQDRRGLGMRMIATLAKSRGGNVTFGQCGGGNGAASSRIAATLPL
ncbi:sensor histidine kinase [Microvirga sp. VF16]|uniref:sensor histidine kinase n=1 Tax=Microvirga sp. VF16 TaxID=2807101 RepID=UPI00193DB583|nr:histidine kinase dimerization/phosphoacceptor domain -containing protein [Microvirga sp. VF16]QRM28623.1 PAS domain S-box protein [Microvirga sp. VF16]